MADARHAGDVGTRAVQAGYEAQGYWVITKRKDDRHGTSARGLCRLCGVFSHREDDGYPFRNQVRRQSWQSIIFAVGPAIFNDDIMAFNVARLAQAPSESVH